MPLRTALPVLLYHHVGPKRAGTHPGLTVDPHRFADHLKWLHRQGYRPVASGDVAAWAIEGKPLPRRSVLITFDDAYADLAHTAFPMLRDRGWTAITFVVTGLIGCGASWDDITRAHRTLSVDELRSWSASGIEFGAHTRTHPDLTSLPPSQARDEIHGSRTELERLLQRPVTAFAYPYGYVNGDVRRLAAESFEIGFTTEQGPNYSRGDPLLIRRTMVQSKEHLLDVSLRLRLGRSPWQRIRWAVGTSRRRLKGRSERSDGA